MPSMLTVFKMIQLMKPIGIHYERWRIKHVKTEYDRLGSAKEIVVFAHVIGSSLMRLMHQKQWFFGPRILATLSLQ